jgi:hypothetical protein
MKRTIAAVLFGSAAIASAGTPPEDATLYSSVGWGQTVVPERASVTTQAGYDGSQQRAQATGLVDATILPRLSVFAGVTYGDETAGVSRPAVGGAFQILDPRFHVVGVRVSGAYKPEGLAEPEGELESVLVLSHLVDRDVARTFIAYGSDPDGHESDAEVGAGYLHRLADHWVIGSTARYRRAIAMKTPDGPRWDAVGGAVGDLLVGEWRVEMLVGGGAVGAAKVSTGPLALVSVGIDL